MAKKDKKEPGWVSMCISVPPDFKDKIKALAAADDRTISSFVRVKLEPIL